MQNSAALSSEKNNENTPSAKFVGLVVRADARDRICHTSGHVDD